MSDKSYGGVSLGEIDFNTETEEQIKEFVSFVKTNSKLTFVSFYGNSKTSKISLYNWSKLKPILEAIAENTSIQISSFGRCCFEEVNIEQVQILQEFIKKSYIKRVLFEDDSIQKPCPALDFIASIPSTPVEHLHCFMLGFGEEDFAVVQKLKPLSMGNLITLSLRFNFIGRSTVLETENDSYANFLLSLFSGKLKQVDLADNQLGCSIITNDWRNIFKKVNENKSLQALDLSSCGFEILTECDENDKEFIELFETFLQETTLTEINLTGNQFWHETTERVLRAALKNENLTLKLDTTALSEREVKELKESIRKELSEQKKPQDQELKEIHDIPSSTKPLILSNGMNSGNSQSGVSNLQNSDSPRSKDKLKI